MKVNFSPQSNASPTKAVIWFFLLTTGFAGLLALGIWFLSLIPFSN